MDDSDNIHFYILWLPQETLDWEPYHTREEAELTALRLMRSSKSYAIKEFDESCASPLCKVLRTGKLNP